MVGWRCRAPCEFINIFLMLPCDSFYVVSYINSEANQQGRCSIVVSIPACHAGDPGKQLAKDFVE